MLLQLRQRDGCRLRVAARQLGLQAGDFGLQTRYFGVFGLDAGVLGTDFSRTLRL